MAKRKAEEVIVVTDSDYSDSDDDVPRTLFAEYFTPPRVGAVLSGRGHPLPLSLDLHWFACCCSPQSTL